ncbi:MAG TPA: diacylglycerol kinase family protein [Actinomycetota bacterium]|nr:diacylglycerol kinase family protein [Actinomycetota bacterium]
MTDAPSSLRPLVIVNPRAGTGAGAATARLEELLRAQGLHPDVRVTSGPGHASELAAEAQAEGRSMVVAAGGDGTVSEVVNGLLQPGGSPDAPVLGILPLGSGCDYVKTFGIDAQIEQAAARIASDSAPVPVDAARISFTTLDGPAQRVFVNIAEAGIGAEVVEAASQLPRRLGPAVYFTAFWKTLPRFSRRHAMLQDPASDQVLYEGSVMNVVVAIGRVFGGGMRVAPDADPADGLLDVQVHAGSKLDFVRALPKVYRGAHLPHPRIHEHRVSSLRLECEPAALIEADGEVLGTTPATFEVLPHALRLKV